jgi:hypothetical protein
VGRVCYPVELDVWFALCKRLRMRRYVRGSGRADRSDRAGGGASAVSGAGYDYRASAFGLDALLFGLSLMYGLRFANAERCGGTSVGAVVLVEAVEREGQRGK